MNHDGSPAEQSEESNTNNQDTTLKEAAPEEAAVENGTNKKSDKLKQLLAKKPVQAILVLAIIAAGYWGFTYWKDTQEYVFIEKAQITAPGIELGPGNTGILKKVYVSEGDLVKANQLVAIIGDEYIRTEIAGVVIGVNNSPGQIFSRGQWIVKMIDPKELRIVGRVEEDKGLSDIHEGMHTKFTVDAFGSRNFDGEVESISQTSREGDVVFSISDKREEKEFNVKVQYDHSDNPQFRNGMSARLWVRKGQ